MNSSRQKALQQVVALSMMMTAFSWNSVEALPEGGTVVLATQISISRIKLS